MNEQNFEKWWASQNTRLTDIPVAQARFIFRSIIEYARGKQEPVAKVYLGKREVSCHGPNRRYAEGLMVQLLTENIEPETLLYSHSQPAKPAESDITQTKLGALQDALVRTPETIYLPVFLSPSLICLMHTLGLGEK